MGIYDWTYATPPHMALKAWTYAALGLRCQIAAKVTQVIAAKGDQVIAARVTH